MLEGFLKTNRFNQICIQCDHFVRRKPYFGIQKRFDCLKNKLNKFT